MSERSLSRALSSVLRRIPISRTLVPPARIRSATGPGLYSVTTSVSCLVYFRIRDSWISAPPASRPGDHVQDLHGRHPLHCYVAPVEKPLERHPGGPVLLAGVDPGQRHEPEIGQRSLHGARVVVASVVNRAPGGGVHRPVRIGEAPDGRAHELAEARPASADLGLELAGLQAGQPDMRRCRASRSPCPRPRARPPGWRESRGQDGPSSHSLVPPSRPEMMKTLAGEAAALQLGQRRLEHADVPVVERDADQPARAAGPDRVDQRPDPDPAQAQPLQRMPSARRSGPACTHSWLGSSATSATPWYIKIIGTRARLSRPEVRLGPAAA